MSQQAALLLAVYQEGVQRILDRVEAAVATKRGPWRAWKRPSPRMSIHSRRQRFRARRHSHPANRCPGDRCAAQGVARSIKSRFRRYFSAITLPRDRDAAIARLSLLGAMNWTPVWYQEGGESAQTITREFLAPLRALAGVKSLRGRK